MDCSSRSRGDAERLAAARRADARPAAPATAYAKSSAIANRQQRCLPPARHDPPRRMKTIPRPADDRKGAHGMMHTRAGRIPPRVFDTEPMSALLQHLAPTCERGRPSPGRQRGIARITQGRATWRCDDQRAIRQTFVSRVTAAGAQRPARSVPALAQRNTCARTRRRCRPELVPMTIARCGLRPRINAKNCEWEGTAAPARNLDEQHNRSTASRDPRSGRMWCRCHRDPVANRRVRDPGPHTPVHRSRPPVVPPKVPRARQCWGDRVHAATARLRGLNKRAPQRQQPNAITQQTE